MKTLRKVALGLGATLMLAALGLAFVEYFVTSVSGSVVRDGLGRVLSTSPWFMRLIFGQERLWAGWGWFIGDLAIFWGAMGLGIMLITFGTSETPAGA